MQGAEEFRPNTTISMIPSLYKRRTECTCPTFFGGFPLQESARYKKMSISCGFNPLVGCVGGGQKYRWAGTHGHCSLARSNSSSSWRSKTCVVPRDVRTGSYKDVNVLSEPTRVCSRRKGVQRAEEFRGAMSMAFRRDRMQGAVKNLSNLLWL